MTCFCLDVKDCSSSVFIIVTPSQVALFVSRGTMSGSFQRWLFGEVIVSSELLPWSNSGGLGRVTASLSQQFAMRGHRTMQLGNECSRCMHLPVTIGHIFQANSTPRQLKCELLRSVAPMYTRPPPEEGFTYLGSEIWLQTAVVGLESDLSRT